MKKNTPEFEPRMAPVYASPPREDPSFASNSDPLPYPFNHASDPDPWFEDEDTTMQFCSVCGRVFPCSLRSCPYCEKAAMSEVYAGPDLMPSGPAPEREFRPVPSDVKDPNALPFRVPGEDKPAMALVYASPRPGSAASRPAPKNLLARLKKGFRRK